MHDALCWQISVAFFYDVFCVVQVSKTDVH